MTSQIISEGELEKLCEELSLTKPEARFVHEANPLHYSARLQEMGFQREDAMQIAHFYSEVIYRPVMDLYKYKQETGELNNGIRE